VGQKPYAGVVSGRDGALYGTTLGGGSNSAGTVFKMNTDGSGYATLRAFVTNGVDGQSPGALTQASEGALYGMTAIGGTNRAGTVYTLNVDGSGYSVLHVFGSVARDGGNPEAGLTEGSDGGLYGTTFFGGSNDLGTVFRLSKDGNSYGLLCHFGRPAGDGANPAAAVVQGADGALYGTTFFGGTNDAGTVFKLNINGGGYSLLRMFTTNGLDGRNPDAALMQASNGALYGTTYGGGASNAGTIFTLSTNGGGYNLLHSFRSFADDAQSPLGALSEGKDGLLYGMTYSGGSNGVGAIFKLARDGTNYSVWRGFLSSGGDGQNPRGRLSLGSDGAFYGTTWNGGQSGAWTVFQIYPPETPDMLGAVESGNTAQVWFSGVSGYHYQVLRSTNLVDWAALGTILMPVSAVSTNIDPAAPMAGAFYRAAWVP
jgi:uncharacterized repeat protein (TIGR03803 family)